MRSFNLFQVLSICCKTLLGNCGCMKGTYCGTILLHCTWEVVCLQQLVQCLLPAVVEDKIIPFRDDVAKWAAMRALTEWNTTFHASCCLHTQSIPNMSKVIDFIPVFETFLCRTIHPRLSLVLNKTPAKRDKC